MDHETIGVWAVIIISVVGASIIVVNVDKESTLIDMKIADFTNQNHLIKEMTTDMTISGSFSGSYLLIAGGVYGSIDQQRVITVIYGTPKDGMIIYKTMSLSLTEVEFVTVDKSISPSLKIIEGTSLDIDTLKYNIRRARLYLPDGWIILNGKVIQ